MLGMAVELRPAISGKLGDIGDNLCPMSVIIIINIGICFDIDWIFQQCGELCCGPVAPI